MSGVVVRRVAAWPRKRDYYVAPGIYRAVLETDADIVHVQSWHTPVAPLAMAAAIRRRAPFVVTPHGRGHAGPLRRAIRPAQRVLFRKLVLHASHLIAIARFEKAALVRELGVPDEKVTVIPNGSDLELPTGHLPAARGGAVIASVGRLEKFKGHHRIIEALPHVLARRPDAQLEIAGSGAYERALRRLVRELDLEHKVTILSFPMAEPERLTRWLGGISLLVLLSEYETQPIAALEAAALGKPVLVSGAAGLRELAEDGLAQLVPVDSPQSLADAVLGALEEPIVPPPFAISSWDDCVDALLRIYVRYARR